MRYLLVLLAGLAKEAASNQSPCTAALGLEPVYSAKGPDGEDRQDGVLQQGDKVTVDIYAVNDCVRRTDQGQLVGVAAQLDGEVVPDATKKSGHICIKPAARFSRLHQSYDPQPWKSGSGYEPYYEPDSVQGLVEKPNPASQPSMWRWSKESPHWCAMCKEVHDGDDGCFSMVLKEGQTIPLLTEERTIYLFSVEFTVKNTITAEMADYANRHEIVFQAQTPPAMVQIMDDEHCTSENAGGGQGSVPYRFQPATTTATSTTRTSTTMTETTQTTTQTTTTTRCSWPCCKELRNFMDNVVDFIEKKFDHNVAGDHSGGFGTCTSGCFAATDDECPNEEAAATLFSVSPALPPANEAAGGSSRTSSSQATEAKVTRLEQEAKAMQEKIDKLELGENTLEQEARAMREEAKAMREKIARLESEAKVMLEKFEVASGPGFHTSLQLVAGAQDEARPEPQGTNIALVVVVSAICAVMVQVIVAALPRGRPASPWAQEPLLLGQ